MSSWDIEWYSCGEWRSCLYSCCCCPYALGESRSFLDGSQWIFNYYCLNTCTTRWLIRTAYGIEGSALGDCLCGTFCCPCAINQMYQTAYNRGNPIKDIAGFHNNVGEYQTSLGCTLSNCCYATFCGPCAIGTGMNRLMGMPWLFGCCCISPCAARQLMRYQYRIRGTDVGGDLVAPTTLFYISYALAGCTFGASYALLFPYTIGMITHLLAETESRNGAGVAAGATRYFTEGGSAGVVTASAIKY